MSCKVLERIVQTTRESVARRGLFFSDETCARAVAAGVAAGDRWAEAVERVLMAEGKQA